MYEYRFGGEAGAAAPTTDEEWARTLYLRENAAGVQTEWWFHRAGCRTWFQAVRDTVTNQVERTFRPGGESPTAGTTDEPVESLEQGFPEPF